MPAVAVLKTQFEFLGILHSKKFIEAVKHTRTTMRDDPNPLRLLSVLVLSLLSFVVVVDKGLFPVSFSAF
jgi:hypothetical protein